MGVVGRVFRKVVVSDDRTGNEAEAQAAIAGMYGQSLGGRAITVNEVRPVEARPPRTGGFVWGGGPGGY